MLLDKAMLRDNFPFPFPFPRFPHVLEDGGSEKSLTQKETLCTG